MRLPLALVLLSGAASADYMDHFAIREDVGPHKAPSLGEVKILVMPVEVKGHPPLDLAALERFFSPDDPDGFVHYYETASLGRYRPRVTVGPKITFDTCPLPAATFPDCSVARGDINAFGAGIDMIREVVKQTRDQGFDFSTIDVTGRRGGPDGWVDGVMLLTNVPFGGIAFPIGYFNHDDNLDGGTGGPLIVNGVKVGHVAIAGDGNPYVLVHEFGHLLGLTDLYDESGTYAGLHLSVMGTWGYDANIVLPDAETRFRLRWANWHQVQGEQRVRIPPVETSGQVYRLGTGDEYFLVENRGPGEFDKSLHTRGLAVFHVDRTVGIDGREGAFVQRLLNCVNCDPWHPYIGLLQADGQFDIEKHQPFDEYGDLFRAGSALKVDPSGQAPSKDHLVLSSNYWSGAASGLKIGNIVVRSDGSIDATLTAPATGQCDDRLCADGDGCAPVDCGVSNAGCTAAPGGLLAALAAVLVAAGRRTRGSGG